MTELLDKANLGSLQEAVGTALREMETDHVIKRVWRHDYTVWKPDPDEIVNRLGWLHIAETMRASIPRLEKLAQDVKSAGYTDALLMGMGGSSLAPEVFSKIFSDRVDGLNLSVLDSTVPSAVLHYTNQIDLARTLFIVASKSGSTAETLSFFKTMYDRALAALGRDRAGEHFVAITDPGSRLADMGETYSFRDVFVNDPNIGGRYSALSFFGIVPAALVGVDLARLLEQALAMAAECASSVAVVDNPAAQLGAILGESAKAGRDKLTFITSKQIVSFGDWVEQLVAESTGKAGTGILPVVREPLGSLAVYDDDRLFIHIGLADDEVLHDQTLDRLEQAGHPVVRLNLSDVYDLGAQMFLWKMAVAMAGHRLGIHPFNQPNVEAAKRQARRMIAVYEEKGTLPTGDSSPVEATTLHQFVSQHPQAGAPSPHSDRPYIALHAYLQPTPDTTEALQTLRLQLGDRYQLATTLGYGPRFLHSSGQLHKGDAGNGTFIQFTADDPEDVPIPKKPGASTSAITFGVLKMAQALGDRKALEEAGRRVIHFHLGPDASEAIRRLTRP